MEMTTQGSQGSQQPKGMGTETGRWARFMKKLDEVLAATVEKTMVQAIALTSKPATGKSTAFIRRVWNLAKAGKTPPDIAYIVSSDTEAVIIREWLRENGVVCEEEEDGCELSVLTWRQCFPALKNMTWGLNCTIIIDVNWYPTVMDEIAYGWLRRWAERCRFLGETGTEVHIAIVLLMSTFVSERTVKLFSGCLAKDPHTADTTTSNVPYPTLDVDVLEAGWEKEFEEIVLEGIEGGGRVAIGSDVWERWGRFAGALTMDDIDDLPPDWTPEEFTKEDWECRLIQEEAKVLAPHPLLPYSTRMEGMRLFLAPGVVEGCHIWHPDIMQVLKGGRKLEWCEKLRQHSWVFKSTSNNSHIRFLGTPLGDAPPPDERSVERFGPAWNRDLLFFVLAGFESWPGLAISSMPFRAPINLYSVAEGVRRLCYLKCIERSESGHRCTELGAMIMKIYWREEEEGYEFHVIYLLARATLARDIKPEVRRALIRIAALAHHGPDKIFTKGDPTDVRTLQQCLPPLVQKRSFAGVLWVSLGFYLACESAGWFKTTKTYEKGWSPKGLNRWGVDCMGAEEVGKRVRKFEKAIGMDEVKDKGWINTPLDDSQIEFIEKELMWSWLHRIALIDRTGNAVDSVSLKRPSVDLDKEVIQVTPVRAHCDHVTVGGGLFNVIYLSLLGNDSSEMVAKHLTWVPPEAFQEIREKTGVPWPNLVGKSV
ncbi:hypothetical protein GGR53DRAFT_54445 [Hypoxylon sp. FL1150]|nr:hypothetical protein GGR53DRAFT_54445 [Hypoxylon sp. FL1150]